MADSVASNVAVPTGTYNRLAKKWKLPRDLMGGTTAMRMAREAYLPKEAGERDLAYDARLSRTTLFNAFRKTVRDMTGKVFQTPVVLKDDMSDKLKQYAENVDLAGRNVNVFAKDVFFDGMQTGITYILADMPPTVTRQDGQPATLADEKAAGNRPYLVHVKAENLIGWKSNTVGGVETLTQIRIKECVIEESGDFGETEVEQIRVIEPGTWETWRKNAKGAWESYQKGTTSVNKITIAPVYINRTGFMCGEPPLEDLADLNVAHWQSQSDQRNILHVARVPILFAAGWKDDDKVTIGANSMIKNSDANAKLTYVEHNGGAIGAGDKDLANLEFQMQTQGLQLLIPQPGGKTATGAILDDSKENSPLAMAAAALEDAIEQAFGFMAEYDGEGADAAGSVVVNKEFGLDISSHAIRDLIDMCASNQISKQTFWSELHRRGFLSDDFDAEAEKELLATEPPPIIGTPPGRGLNVNGPVG